eukprot:270420-Amphidinium_carterae.1
MTSKAQCISQPMLRLHDLLRGLALADAVHGQLHTNLSHGKSSCGREKLMVESLHHCNVQIVTCVVMGYKIPMKDVLDSDNGRNCNL